MPGKPRLFWSAAANGFFDAGLHAGAIPPDAVAITPARHARLLGGQAQGHAIVAGTGGKPRLIAPANDVGALRTRALNRLDSEARRRAIAIASLERQSNDNAAIALAALQIASAGATAVDLSAPLQRRAAIDAVRADHARAAAAIATLDRAALLEFDAADPAHWPSEK